MKRESHMGYFFDVNRRKKLVRATPRLSFKFRREMQRRVVIEKKIFE